MIWEIAAGNFPFDICERYRIDCDIDKNAIAMATRLCYNIDRTIRFGFNE